MIRARHLKITPFFVDRRGGCIYDHCACSQHMKRFSNASRETLCLGGLLPLRILMCICSSLSRDSERALHQQLLSNVVLGRRDS